MTDRTEKLVVVLNKTVETGKAMNALAHAMLGFGVGVATRESVQLNQYVDADGNVYANISELPIVVLRGGSSKIRRLRQDCNTHDIKHVVFTESMTIGTYKEEYELTATIPEAELVYYAMVLMGNWDQVTALTRRFSLYQ